ncbi:MAG: hypothetical protein HYU27_05990 [Acidobacteria bacterium]|nr:hypothetical protein [Acidobacteriota bacterium]
MKTKLAIAVFAMMLAPLAALAHHSFAAEFDASKPVVVQGTVTKVEWTNPHIWIYVDMKDAAGAVAHWQCEGGSPNTLVRQGWSKNSLKQGDQVTIDGSRAKDGTNTCNARAVKLADGKRLFAGSSGGDR